MTDADLLRENGKLRKRIDNLVDGNRLVSKTLYEEGVSIETLNKINKLIAEAEIRQ